MDNCKTIIPTYHSDILSRKKCPIYRKTDLPRIARKLIYRRVLESPLIYSLVPIERLYGQIMEELEEGWNSKNNCLQ